MIAFYSNYYLLPPSARLGILKVSLLGFCCCFFCTIVIYDMHSWLTWLIQYYNNNIVCDVYRLKLTGIYKSLIVQFDLSIAQSFVINDFYLFMYVHFYLNGKSYLHVSRLSSVESRLPPIHVVEVNRAVKLLFSVNSPDFSKKWSNCEEVYNPKWRLSKIYRKRLKNSSRSWKKSGVKEGQFEQKFPRWVLKWLILIPTGI